MQKFILFLTVLIAQFSWAASPIEKLYFNAGSHTEFYNQIQNDDKGGIRKFDFAPTLGMGAVLPLIQAFKFYPEFNWVLPQSAGSSKIIKNLLMFRADIGYDPLSWLRIRVGTGVLLANQQGRGGTTSERNGNTTSTFYYPDENRSSINNTVDVGVEFLFSDEFSARLQTYTYSFLNDERRQLSYSLFLTYYWEL